MAVYAVVGAGGATGLECVKRLLQVSEDKVRAVVRDPEKYMDVFPLSDSKLEVVKGDVTDADSLTAALQGTRGVVFAASGQTYWSAAAVDFKGVVSVAEAAKRAATERVVLVSSMLVHPANRFNPIRILLNNIRWGLMDNKHKGEEALRASGLSYTIVRPGGLTNKPGGEAEIAYAYSQTKEIGGGGISRADVAAVAVEALTNPKADKTTLSIWGGGSKEGIRPLAEQLQAMFSSAVQDTPAA